MDELVTKMDEFVIRDPKNKRIRKMVKINIPESIKQECEKSMDYVLFIQDQQISELFKIIDQKQSFGILSVIGSCILGIENYKNEESKKRYIPQYHRCYNSLYESLVNLSGQLIFSLTYLDPRLLDQAFIKKTIESIVQLQMEYINSNKNNIFPSQKEFLNGQIKELIELYNNRIQKAIESCNMNDSWWSRITIFDNSIYKGCSYFEAYANILINSRNQTQYKQQLLKNKIDITFEELPNHENKQLEEITPKGNKDRKSSHVPPPEVVA